MARPGDAEAFGTLNQPYAKMPFADAWVVRLSETLPDALVYTTDKRGFGIYRRRRNETIQAITP